MPNENFLANGEGKATTAVVGILNLQVFLVQEGNSWIAQAIELDYAAGGSNLEDVKTRFEDGLCATIQEHFNLFGNLDKLVGTPAPTDYWLDLVKHTTPQCYSQVSVHKFAPKLKSGVGAFFPYGEIKYITPAGKHEPVMAEA